MTLTFNDVQVDLNGIPKTLTESFDKMALNAILANPELIQRVMSTTGELVHSNWHSKVPSLDKDANETKDMTSQMRILEAYSRKGGAEGKKSVAYYRKKWGGVQRGRRFAPGSLSLQSISRPIRHTIAGLLYFDADMKNCHPVALEHFCAKHDIPTPLLHRYNADRDALFKELIEVTADTTMPANKDTCKTLMLKIVNGGRINKELQAWGKCIPSWVDEVYQEMHEVRERICKLFPEEYEEVERVKEYNPKGTLVNRLLNILEDNAMQYMFKFFTNEGHMPEVLCFDGLMVPRKGFDCEEEFDALCEQCTAYVQHEMGYPFVIVRKDMNEGFRDELAINSEVAEPDDAVDDDSEDLSHLDEVIQWLLEHLPVKHFDSQDHGIYWVAQCMLHLQVPKAVIRNELSISLPDVEAGFANYEKTTSDDSDKIRYLTRSWLITKCAEAGSEYDATKHVRVRSRVDKDDNFDWLDFQKLTHGHVYPSYEHAQDGILMVLPRILSLVTAGAGMVVVKDNAETPFAIKNLQSLVHTVAWGGSTQELPAFIKANKNLLPCFSSIVFKPNDVGLKPNELNTWPGFRAQLVQEVGMELVLPWLNHIRDVWASGDEHYYRYIMSWLHHILTHPEVPSEKALVIMGEQGAGKTITGDFLCGNVFGRAVSLTTTGLDSITARFNACFMSKIFINANELTTMGDTYHGAFDKMKAFITDKTVQIEQKGREHINMNNCANFLCTTNHDWTVKLEAGDRRYACFTCSNVRLGDAEYFTDLAACMTDTHGDHFFTYMTTMFSDTVPLRRIPKTELRMSMMESSKSACIRFMEEFVDQPEMAFNGTLEVFIGQRRITSLEQVFDIGEVSEQQMRKDTLYQIYQAWVAHNKEKQLRSYHQFCKEIKKYVRAERTTGEQSRVQTFIVRGKESSEDALNGMKRKQSLPRVFKEDKKKPRKASLQLPEPGQSMLKDLVD